MLLAIHILLVSTTHTFFW